MNEFPTVEQETVFLVTATINNVVSSIEGFFMYG